MQVGFVIEEGGIILFTHNDEFCEFTVLAQGITLDIVILFQESKINSDVRRSNYKNSNISP